MSYPVVRGAGYALVVAPLWKAGIYAESGIGCTGPIVLVKEGKIEEATKVLEKSGFVAEEGTPC